MYKCMDFFQAFHNPAIYGRPGMRLGQHLSPSVGAPFLSPPPETQTVREGGREGGREGQRERGRGRGREGEREGGREGERGREGRGREGGRGER